jgi:murein L,D-transpeptidase YafK
MKNHFVEFQRTARAGLMIVTVVLAWLAGQVQAEPRAEAAWINQERYLTDWLERDGFVLGTRMHLQIYKASRELEVHLFRGGRFEHFRTFRICSISGDLGPKLHEGDLQAPEGVYRVTPEALHPRSDHHLAFNLGFPNRHDRNIGATGSNIMIHGGCASEGCFAITDYYMEQLWVLAEAAFRNGQDAIGVHVFPFRFTQANVDRYGESEHWPFWASLKPLARYFADHGWPARVAVDDVGYRLVDARSEATGHQGPAAP